jgi:SAM-dependent methyltransferase
MLALLRLTWAKLGSNQGYSDRPYLTDTILPALTLAKVKRVLFVGCRWYTMLYGRQLIRASIDYWTTDIDPALAIWGQQRHHIICDVAEIDHVCPSAWFDVVLLNGVFGYGINENSQMNRAVEAIARILRPSGILLIGWDTHKIPDPTDLDAVKTRFCRDQVLPLPVRKTFPDTDHVYDWLLKST